MLFRQKSKCAKIKLLSSPVTFPALAVLDPSLSLQKSLGLSLSSVKLLHLLSNGKSIQPSPSLSIVSLHCVGPQSDGQVTLFSPPSQTPSPQLLSSLSL